MFEKWEQRWLFQTGRSNLMTKEGSTPTVNEQPVEPTIESVVESATETRTESDTQPQVPISEPTLEIAPESIPEVSPEASVVGPTPTPVTVVNEAQTESSPIVGPVTPSPVSEPASSTLESASQAESTITAPVASTIVEKVVYKPTLEMMHTLQRKSLVSIQNRKRKKIEKIMTLFTKKQKITTVDVQKFLIVSHNTAVRYMDILEKENRVKQVGKKGSSVFYTKI